MLDFLITYSSHIVIIALFVLGIVFSVKNEITNIKEWLLSAVVDAEKLLGSKTGKIKLRQVYDWFIASFPIASKLITFNTFSRLVDKALDEMEEMLKTNENLAKYVGGGKE